MIRGMPTGEAMGGSRRVRFRSWPLPAHLDRKVRSRLRAAHRQEPFSPADPRAAAQRAAQVLAPLGLEVTVFRGGLDLRGAEVDHLWLAGFAAGAPDGGPFVLDPAFPLFDRDFVALLRSYVAGDGSREDLAAAAAGADLDDRVLGEFPPPINYLGSPVWSQR